VVAALREIRPPSALPRYVAAFADPRKIRFRGPNGDLRVGTFYIGTGSVLGFARRTISRRRSSLPSSTIATGGRSSRSGRWTRNPYALTCGSLVKVTPLLTGIPRPLCSYQAAPGRAEEASRASAIGPRSPARSFGCVILVARRLRRCGRVRAVADEIHRQVVFWIAVGIRQGATAGSRRSQPASLWCAS